MAHSVVLEEHWLAGSEVVLEVVSVLVHLGNPALVVKDNCKQDMIHYQLADRSRSVHGTPADQQTGSNEQQTVAYCGR